ncbi:MAG: VanW family protein, partial [Clostridia bacterium]|nr:VanW family protein [Clostridia bacterium]
MLKLINGASEYEANKTSANSTSENTQNTTNTTNATNKNNETPQENKDTTPAPAPQTKEEQIATFSTKIYSNDAARQNNISITCNTLNDTIVKNGETFSFCGTVGQSSTSKGYQKADIFDKNGNKKKGLGGGNCQISSTLYNALLSVPTLVITERHAHSNYVPYIDKGKDAAVAYGSYDLKF